MKLDLTTPVAGLGRIGTATASRLKRLGIETASDLIFYYPFRWEDLSQVYDIVEVQAGQIVTVKGKLQLIKSRRSSVKRRLLVEGLVADKTGSIKIIWFNQKFLTKVLKPGDEIYLSGKVSFDRYTLQLVNPVYEKVKPQGTTHTARVVPIYSLTGNLTQKQIRFLIKESLSVIDLIDDFIPAEILKSNKLIDIQLALNQIHFPKNKKLLDQAIQRLKFNELFLFQLQIVATKIENQSSQAEKIKFYEQQTKDFVTNLPFELTVDQRKTAWQILSDLGKSKPMNRLLEGDVGAGKTVVATIAMLNVWLNKKQTAMIAPTEILASQHYKKILGFFKSNKINIGLLTRSQASVNNRTTTKTNILKEIESGIIDIVIGTHSLIQEKVVFHNLALAVVDEQHRFGVSQRKLLKEKSGDLKTIPHLLSMTATPIPRSLALTLYGDLDLSMITTLPKNRKKIITKIIDPQSRPEVYDFIRRQVGEGRQIFVICPLIDPSDKLGVKAVTEEYDKLKKEIFPDLKISLLHGKLKANDKERIMSDFFAQQSDILVATSVVEVGVDVPNASVMLIEGAERFGLAQLHQFRGRVGRSIYQSHCFIFTENVSQKTKARLQALVTAKNGFELAEYDLKFRGPGEIYGVRQSGWLDFRIAQLTDHSIIQVAKQAAEKVIDLSPDLKKYPALKEKADQLIKSIHLE